MPPCDSGGTRGTGRGSRRSSGAGGDGGARAVHPWAPGPGSVPEGGYPERSSPTSFLPPPPPGIRGGHFPFAAAVATISAAVVVAAAVGILLFAHGPSPTAGSLHVVSVPVAAGGTVTVLDTTTSHTLELSGVDPVTQAVVWHVPFSSSSITPGLQFGPALARNVILDLAPVAGSGGALVDLEGLDPSTGKSLWSSPAMEVSDAPAPCRKGHYFCLAVYLGSGDSDALVIDPKTGHVVEHTSGSLRNMSQIHGTTVENNIWESSAPTPTFVGVGKAGSIAWTRAVSDIFGGPRFTPNDGWAFQGWGSLAIGSVGFSPQDERRYRPTSTGP